MGLVTDARRMTPRQRAELAVISIVLALGIILILLVGSYVWSALQ